MLLFGCWHFRRAAAVPVPFGTLAAAFVKRSPARRLRRLREDFAGRDVRTPSCLPLPSSADVTSAKNISFKPEDTPQPFTVETDDLFRREIYGAVKSRLAGLMLNPA
ncbi:hypothetical protein M5K25_018562 [Dendrobium thyrsiflorum]|uniref:Uncharacterized protein n=1 Tax=Dendrobium thyrsiflorum TaxID=117978 RepID=A0ABD0UIC6_DENTH